MLRTAARLLPTGLRRQIKDSLRRLIGPSIEVPIVRRGRERAPATDHINIVGYVRSEHGVGESARSCARAAQAVGLPFSLIDFNEGNTARTADDTWASHIVDRPAPGVVVCHINADQTPRLHTALGRDFFADRYTIGFWHWELPEFPDAWLGSFALVDEVWAPTQFVADAVSRKSPVPVVRMPHCIHFDTDPAARRSDLGLPEGRFLFLTIYDAQSFQERKNPEAAIAAFRRAFPDGGDVGLVVKINHSHSAPDKVRSLRSALRGVPGVLLIDRTLTRQEVLNLLGQCDALVSLHRSEGFGLCPAEAMFLGKPVIATHWSGNLDFMTVANSCPVEYELTTLKETIGPYEKGQTWAEPDVDNAAWHMRRLVSEAALCRRIGERGRATIRTQFSPAAVGRMYRQRLEVIAQFV